jgi:hypothetical protein
MPNSVENYQNVIYRTKLPKTFLVKMMNRTTLMNNFTVIKMDDAFFYIHLERLP